MSCNQEIAHINRHMKGVVMRQVRDMGRERLPSPMETGMRAATRMDSAMAGYVLKFHLHIPDCTNLVFLLHSGSVQVQVRSSI